MPGNYDLDEAIKLAKTVKKAIPKIEIEEKYKRKGTDHTESTGGSVGDSEQEPRTTEKPNATTAETTMQYILTRCILLSTQASLLQSRLACERL